MFIVHVLLFYFYFMVPLQLVLAFNNTAEVAKRLCTVVSALFFINAEQGRDSYLFRIKTLSKHPTCVKKRQYWRGRYKRLKHVVKLTFCIYKASCNIFRALKLFCCVCVGKSM